MTVDEFTRAPKLADEFRKLLNSDTMQIALAVMREAIMMDVPKFSKDNLEGYARYHERFTSLAKIRQSEIPDDYNSKN